VIPWPQNGGQGFITFHAPITSTNGFQSIPEAIDYLDHVNKEAVDVYVCQSQQREQAVRNSSNALCFKALFADFDFKNYPSEPDAAIAFREFCAKTKLTPSVIVHTGGGYHCYWTLATPLSPIEWTPLAHRLVQLIHDNDLGCDTAVTIDMARVLRVPDTTNQKRHKSVRLVHDGRDYSIEELNQLLPSIVTKVRHANGFVPDPSLFPQLEKLTDNPLSEGISQLPKPRLADVARECGFVADTIKTGGRDNLYPLWFQTLNMSMFVEEGVEAAHIMGKGYKTYVKEITDSLFEKATQDQQRKDFGWPQCERIYNDGAKKFCTACPHFGEHKSPLNFARPETPPPPPSPDDAGTTLVLPPNYIRNDLGYILKSNAKPDGTADTTKICDVPIRHAWVQRNPWILNFDADIEPRRTEQVHLPFEMIGAAVELRKELSKQGITIHDHNVKPVKEFLLAWVQILKETKEAVISTSPFGWNSNAGGLEGFVYGGRMFTRTGTKMAQAPDNVTARSYTPAGKAEPWIEAAKLITDQKRPALDCILASSFAAPLVRFTNMRGLMMSCIGESGIGKSTALDTALAVWGHPVRAKNLLHDTDNSVMNKVGELRSLPIYWDDLQPDDTRKYARMVFQMSYGKEKDRMNAQSKRREAGTWQTIMVSTSNYSLMDYVAQHTSTTTAGIYRIFEIPVVEGTIGQIAKTDAARIVGKLDDNYGRIGEQYAQYLGANFLTLEEEVQACQKALDLEVKAKNEERLWTSLIACICVGAAVANRLKYTEIDEAALKEFLVTTLSNMRDELKSSTVDMSKDINVSTILSSFCNAYRARGTLFTNIVHKGKGKPPTGSIQVKGDPTRLDAICIHIGMDDKVMRISSNALTEWLKTKELSRKAFTDALTKKYGMKVVNGIIGGGTQHAVPGLTYMLELNLLDFTDEIDVQQLFEKEPIV
jgi:ABC-type oligopeptide transport system ATPase subunit